MNSRAVVRNALLLFGANWISFYLAIPLWLPVSLAWSQSMTDGTLGNVGVRAIMGVIQGLSAAVAGALAAWAMQKSSSRWWGLGLSVLVVFETFDRERWRIPTRDSLVGLSVQAAICAVLAFGGFLFGEHLRLRRGTRKKVNRAAA
jgi:hypothetical protein